MLEHGYRAKRRRHPAVEAVLWLYCCVEAIIFSLDDFSFKKNDSIAADVVTMRVGVDYQRDIQQVDPQIGDQLFGFIKVCDIPAIDENGGAGPVNKVIGV